MTEKKERKSKEKEKQKEKGEPKNTFSLDHERLVVFALKKYFKLINLPTMTCFHLENRE